MGLTAHEKTTLKLHHKIPMRTRKGIVEQYTGGKWTPIYNTIGAAKKHAQKIAAKAAG